MQLKTFTTIFNNSISFLSTDWTDRYCDLLHDEHWKIIGERVFLYVFKNQITHHTLPTFDEEIIPDYHQHYQYFKNLIPHFDKKNNEKAQLLAKTIEVIPIDSLLIILGQRKTSATITDENGIPPLEEQLLTSCFAPYNAQKSKSARAREKHISRNENTFWGKIEGTPTQKEAITKAIVSKIMEEKTWWNVFTHYKHGVVYEARVASGEGIRWKKSNLELIGFLEAFL